MTDEDDDECYVTMEDVREAEERVRRAEEAYREQQRAAVKQRHAGVPAQPAYKAHFPFALTLPAAPQTLRQLRARAAADYI